MCSTVVPRKKSVQMKHNMIIIQKFIFGSLSFYLRIHCKSLLQDITFEGHRVVINCGCQSHILPAFALPNRKKKYMKVVLIII